MTNSERLATSTRRMSGILLAATVALTVGACSAAAGPIATAGQTVPGAGASGVLGEAGTRSGVAIAPAPSGQATSGGTVVGTVVGSGVAGGGSGTANAGTANAGTAIAYPFYGGSPGVAPDHSILVTGSGQADLAKDGSNRAAAERTALAAAISEARARANAVAAATGVSIQGVLSVSVSVGQTWINPMGVESSGGGMLPPTQPSYVQPAPPVVGTPQVQVNVTVAYTIG